MNELLRENLPKHSKQVPVWVTDRNLFLDGLKAKNGAMFVAEENRKVVGFVSATIETKADDLINVPYVSVGRLAVREEHRRRGIGKSLMERLHKWARGKGIGVVRLAVWGFNKDAIAFYSALGYTMVEMMMERTLRREAR